MEKLYNNKTSRIEEDVYRAKFMASKLVLGTCIHIFVLLTWTICGM